jgi:hypothetical protein
MKLTALLAHAGTALALLGTRQSNPPTELVTINSVRTSGSGCPRRAVSISISSDRTVVTLGFDEFATFIGRGRAAADRSKLCIIDLSLAYPGGYTFAVVEATYHGFAQLDAGVTGRFESEYSFPDNATAAATTTRSDLQGGGAMADGQTYTKHDEIPSYQTVKSPCGGNVNMRVRTRVDLSASRDDAFGSIADEDATFAFTQQVHIGWEPCK